MAQSAFKTLPFLRGTLAAVSPWQGFNAKNDYRIHPYVLGARCAVDSDGTTLTLHGQGDIVAGDFVMVARQTDYGGGVLYVPQTSKVDTVVSISGSDDTILLTSGITGVLQGDWIINLGVDSGTVSDLLYDGMATASRLLMYDSPVSDGDNPEPNSDNYFVTGQGGFYQGYLAASSTVIALLITDQTPTPLGYIPLWALGPEVAA
jgi:hypothetical protein